jgi:hypothetical protein
MRIFTFDAPWPEKTRVQSVMIFSDYLRSTKNKITVYLDHAVEA